MRINFTRAAVGALLALAIAGIAMTRSSYATVQDGGICWDPDIEYPVPCEEDEED